VGDAERQALIAAARAISARLPVDWAEIDARLHRLVDPLFGGKVTQGYLRLHQRIMALRV